VVEKAEETGEAVVYRGFVHLPGADLPLEVRVEMSGGATHARIGEGSEGARGVGPPAAPPWKGAAEMEKAAAALVRAATKAALAGGGALPRKIVRWRG
jgi:hypothetical protein